MKIPPSQRLPALGCQPSERTDSEYIDKTDLQYIHDYIECPEPWRGVMLAGMTRPQVQVMLDYMEWRERHWLENPSSIELGKPSEAGGVYWSEDCRKE